MFFLVFTSGGLWLWAWLWLWFCSLPRVFICVKPSSLPLAGVIVPGLLFFFCFYTDSSSPQSDATVLMDDVLYSVIFPSVPADLKSQESNGRSIGMKLGKSGRRKGGAQLRGNRIEEADWTEERLEYAHAYLDTVGQRVAVVDSCLGFMSMGQL